MLGASLTAGEQAALAETWVSDTEPIGPASCSLVRPNASGGATL